MPPTPITTSSSNASRDNGPPSVVTHGGFAGEEGWSLQFHGFFRAPMRIGMGKRDNPAAGQSATTFHYPLVPDDQYFSWQHTNHSHRDWAELYFTYGNGTVSGTVGIEAFNFTNAAWNNTDAQMGISQAFVTWNPNLHLHGAKLEWKIGSISDRYGEMGMYDAGEYDTYLMGRTHVMGETLAGSYDVSDDWTVKLAHGLGVKRPDPGVYNRSRFTIVNHAHAGLAWNGKAELGLHYMNAFAREEDRDKSDLIPPDVGGPLENPKDGSLTVTGADVRIAQGQFGYLYAGFSHVSGKDSIVVGPAFEVIHADGGGYYELGVVDNYWDGPNRASNGNGSVDSIAAQYEFSLANLILQMNDPEAEFYGEGQDIYLKLYGMYNMVKSDDPDMDGRKKLKYGADVAFSALPWFVVAGRYDRVQPNDEVPEQSFGIFSPRVTFRSTWVTREEITLQYSRYLYNQRTCDDPAQPTKCVQPAAAGPTPDGFGATWEASGTDKRGAPEQRPDVNVVQLSASMWW